MPHTFYVYQKLVTSGQKKYRVYNGSGKTRRVTAQENNELEYNFECKASTKKELKAFHRKLLQESVELSGYLRFNRRPFEVHKFRRMGSAIRFAFTQLAGDRIPQDIEPLDPQEYYWMQDCHNTCIIFGEEKGEGEFYGYDFQQFFPSLLAGAHKTKMYMPIKRGTEQALTELPSSVLEPGYYRVKIICTDPRFRRLFSFSKRDTYTSVSLTHAREMMYKYFRDSCTIELIQDGKPNAYLYSKEAMVCTGRIFEKWHQEMSSIRKALPHNRLAKLLHSSLYSRLAEGKKMTLNEHDQEALQRFTERGWEFLNARPGKIILQNYQTAHPLGLRITTWLTAKARHRIFWTMKDRIDDIKRVYVDSVVLTNPIPAKKLRNIQRLEPDDSLTGYLKLNAKRKPVKRKPLKGKVSSPGINEDGN